jgi:transposase
MIPLFVQPDEASMKKKYEIKLTVEEKKKLQSLITKGSEKARKLTRCRILLMADKGQSAREISSSLLINEKTVFNICSRYCKEGLNPVLDEKPRSGAPTLFDGKLRAKITALACSKPPEGRGQWSLRLLADKAIELQYVDFISHTDVGRILKKTK